MNIMLNCVNGRNIQTYRKFLLIKLSQNDDICQGGRSKLMTYAREQDLKCSREGQFYKFFHVFEIKEGVWERLYEGGRKQGWI